jgi:hypothetical protein
MSVEILNQLRKELRKELKLEPFEGFLVRVKPKIN